VAGTVLNPPFAELRDRSIGLSEDDEPGDDEDGPEEPADEPGAQMVSRHFVHAGAVARRRPRVDTAGT
jgi:hypothetical protein